MPTERTQPLLNAIRDVPNFPKPGILFKDITPILSDPDLLRLAVQLLTEACVGYGATKIAATEARGFIFGAPVAVHLGMGFVPIRKSGKLPSATAAKAFELEYGVANIEVHRDSVAPGERVILMDDVLATGGTSLAGIELLESLGARVVAAVFLLELGFLKGRERIAAARNSDSPALPPLAISAILA